jgi:hypothetical protein
MLRTRASNGAVVTAMNTRRVILLPDEESAKQRAARLKEPEWETPAQREAILARRPVVGETLKQRAKRLQDSLDQRVIERERILSKRPGHTPYGPRGRRRHPAPVVMESEKDRG